MVGIIGGGSRAGDGSGQKARGQRADDQHLTESLRRIAHRGRAPAAADGGEKCPDEEDSGGTRSGDLGDA